MLTGAGCGHGTPDEVYAGLQYMLRQYPPKVLFPVHLDGKEFYYRDVSEKIHKNGFSLPVPHPEFSGDHYFYKNGLLQ